MTLLEDILRPEEQVCEVPVLYHIMGANMSANEIVCIMEPVYHEQWSTK